MFIRCLLLVVLCGMVLAKPQLSDLGGVPDVGGTTGGTGLETVLEPVEQVVEKVVVTATSLVSGGTGVTPPTL